MPNVFASPEPQTQDASWLHNVRRLNVNCRGSWLVMDMDGTITSTPSKAGGQYLDLHHSKCRAPLATWLMSGGSIAVISTASRRMWRQVHNVLRPVLTMPNAGRLVLCGFSGAVAFVSDKNGDMVEAEEFRHSGAAGGTTTCLSNDTIPPMVKICQQVIYSFFEAAVQDEGLIDRLSAKYHAPYKALLAQRKSAGKDVFQNEIFTYEAMRERGKFLSTTGDTLLEIQIVPGLEETIPLQLSVLGIPMAVFDDFFTPEICAEMKAKYGAYVKRQPNSVVVARAGIDKATTIAWMAKAGARAAPDAASAENAEAPDVAVTDASVSPFGPFYLKNALAFGDNPGSVDKPMTIFPEMPFVSLSTDMTQDPPGMHHVGGEEDGTAVFLEELFTEIEKVGAAPPVLHGREGLDALAMRAKAKLSEGGIAKL